MDRKLRHSERAWCAGDPEAEGAYLAARRRSASCMGLFRPAPAREEAIARRAALSEGAREALDRSFHAAFKQAARGVTPTDRMHELLVLGAGTSRFDDYELGRDENFGTVVKHWLSEPDRGARDAEIVEALCLTVQAGLAYATNRAYVGNGGAPAIWFVFEWLGAPPRRQERRGPLVLSLLEAMCAEAEPSSPFWRGFGDAFHYMFLAPLARASRPLSAVQREVARLGLELLIERPEGMRRADDGAELSLRVLRALFGIGDPGLIEFVFERAENGIGVFAELPTTLSFEAADPLLRPALRTPRSRALLDELLWRSAWLRGLVLSCPPLVVSLVRRRERKLLATLLATDLERVRALRDAEDNDLLQVACARRGPMQRIVTLLLGRGFDPTRANARGETALDLTRRAGNRRVIALLGARTCLAAPDSSRRERLSPRNVHYCGRS